MRNLTQRREGAETQRVGKRGRGHAILMKHFISLIYKAPHPSPLLLWGGEGAGLALGIGNWFCEGEGSGKGRGELEQRRGGAETQRVGKRGRGHAISMKHFISLIYKAPHPSPLLLWGGEGAGLALGIGNWFARVKR